MKLKKAFIGILSVMVIAVGLGALSGCAGKSDADIIKESLTAELDQLKNPTQDTFNEMMSSIDQTTTSVFQEINLDPTEYLEAYLEGFDYKIGTVKVDGNTATVPVTLTVKNATAVMAAIQAAANKIDLSAGNIEDQMKSALLDGVKSVPATEAEEITLTFQKTDGNWALTPISQALLSASLMN